MFARLGVKELWIVDPEPRTIDQFDLTQDAENPLESLTEDDSISSPILPGLTITGKEVVEW